MLDMPVPGSSKKAQTIWLKLGENRGTSIKSQLTHSDNASNVDEKWSKNHHDLMRPYRVGVPQSSKKC